MVKQAEAKRVSKYESVPTTPSQSYHNHITSHHTITHHIPITYTPKSLPGLPSDRGENTSFSLENISNFSSELLFST
jgi:hypothetical protein